jgi:hypothetical protein
LDVIFTALKETNRIVSARANEEGAIRNIVLKSPLAVLRAGQAPRGWVLLALMALSWIVVAGIWVGACSVFNLIATSI